MGLKKKKSKQKKWWEYKYTCAHPHTEWPFHTNRSQLPQSKNISPTSTSLRCDIMDAMWLLWWRCESCNTPRLLHSTCVQVCVRACACICRLRCQSVCERDGGGDDRRWHHLPNISSCRFINGVKEKSKAEAQSSSKRQQNANITVKAVKYNVRAFPKAAGTIKREFKGVR